MRYRAAVKADQKAQLVREHFSSLLRFLSFRTSTASRLKGPDSARSGVLRLIKDEHSWHTILSVLACFMSLTCLFNLDFL